MVSRPQEVPTDSEEILHDTVNRREPLELSGRRAPSTHEELADIPDFGPWRRDQYAAEILALLSPPADSRTGHESP